MSDSEEIRGLRDSFFLYLKYMWWPEIDERKLPSEDRRLELFRRICTKKEQRNLLKCSLDQFNSILTECHKPSVGRPFFEYFFPDFTNGITLGDFIHGVTKFMKVALWKYGNFNLAFEKLGVSSNVHEEMRNVPFDDVDSVSEAAFVDRMPFDFIRDLTAEERYTLGYTVDKEKIDQGVRTRIESIQEVGMQNTREYLTIDTLDVYIATSMRELNEFKSFVGFVGCTFGHPDLLGLNIRYFDPTVAYCESRIAKGLLEALMLKRAKLTLYVAGEKDTFGKDSECAATLVQGKPVVVYIEKDKDQKGKKLDERAKLFKEIHPLGLQVHHQTGVANGVIVVRTSEECREVLRGLLLHRLKVRLDKISNIGFVLKEEKTDSILRVAVSDPLLVHAFENFYFRES